MGNILYYIAVLMVIFWVIGFFIYSLGALIHLFLLFAFIAVLMKFIQGANGK